MKITTEVKPEEVKPELTSMDIVVIENSNELYNQLLEKLETHEKPIQINCIDLNLHTMLKNHFGLEDVTLDEVYLAYTKIEGADQLMPFSLNIIKEKEDTRVKRMNNGIGQYSIYISKKQKTKSKSL